MCSALITTKFCLVSYQLKCGWVQELLGYAYLA